MTERTTVRLPEDLLRRAKRKAAAEGRTLTSLIEEGLQTVVAGSRNEKSARPRYARISRASGGPLFGDRIVRMSDIDGMEDIERMERIEAQYRRAKE
jgi:hypothetical protein